MTAVKPEAVTEQQLGWRRAARLQLVGIIRNGTHSVPIDPQWHALIPYGQGARVCPSQSEMPVSWIAIEVHIVFMS